MTGEPTLQPGDTSADGWVEYLQKELERKGHPVTVTGTYDDATRDAVVAFQLERGLVADGTVGDQTWAALRDEEAAMAHGEADSPQEQGYAARWGELSESSIVFDPANDALDLLASNVGVTEFAADAFTCDVRLRSADGSIDLPMQFQSRGINGAQQVASGNWFTFYGWGLKQGLGAGTHHVEATLPAELGGERLEGTFTIEG